MVEMWNQILTTIVTAVIIPTIILLGKAGISALESFLEKKKLEAANEHSNLTVTAISLIETLSGNVIAQLQPEVEKLKIAASDGKLSPDEIEQLKKDGTALLHQIVPSSIGNVDVQTLLSLNSEEFRKLLETSIEKQLQLTKT
jgi:hypothetical protein